MAGVAGASAAGLAKVLMEDTAAEQAAAVEAARQRASGSVTADDINSGRVDAELLVTTSGWQLLCRVRSQSAGSVDADAWSELNRRRGYLLRRHNSRGF